MIDEYCFRGVAWEKKNGKLSFIKEFINKYPIFSFNV